MREQLSRKQLNSLPGSLTPRQREIWNFIEKVQKEQGFTPSFQEIAAAIGVNSLATIDAHLVRMEDRGALSKRGNRLIVLNLDFSQQNYGKEVSA